VTHDELVRSLLLERHNGVWRRPRNGVPIEFRDSTDTADNQARRRRILDGIEPGLDRPTLQVISEAA